MGEVVGTSDGKLMGGEVGVTAAGQKPQASGHKVPTSKPAFSVVLVISSIMFTGSGVIQSEPTAFLWFTNIDCKLEGKVISAVFVT